MSRRWVLLGLSTALVLTLALGGCGTVQGYPGERRSADHVATLFRSATLMHVTYSVTVSVRRVDGHTLEGAADYVELLPGLRRLELRWMWGAPLLTVAFVDRENLRGVPPILGFRAEAGKRYRLMVGEDDPKFYVAWVEDEQGTVVGGSRPEPASSQKPGR